MADDPGAPEGTPPPPAPPPPPPPPPAAEDDGTDWKARARQHEREAKKARDQLEALQRTHMTDADKAIAEAKTQGAAEERTKVIGEYGSRLVDAEVRAAAAGRTLDVDALLEGLDRSKFLNDDGSTDTDAITKWLDRLAPTTGFPDLGQGVRTPTDGPDMSALIRRAAGRGG